MPEPERETPQAMVAWGVPFDLDKRPIGSVPQSVAKPGLALGVLRRLTGLLEAVLLAFLDSGISRQVAAGTQGRAQVGVHHEKRTGDAVCKCTGLAGRTATGDLGDNSDVIYHLGRSKRSGRLEDHLLGRKHLIGGPAVNGNSAWRREQTNARNCALSATRSVVVVLVRQLGIPFFGARNFCARDLRLMRVFRSGVYLKPGQHPGTEFCFRQHSFDGVLDNPIRMFVLHRLVRNSLQIARVLAVPQVLFLRCLVASDLHLLGVNHHNEISAEQVRDVARLVLAHQRHGDPRAQTTKRLSIGIDYLPV